MSFATPWINSYNSIMKLVQDPITGMLTGTYASTTGGTGTYDVIGWASLQDATSKLGQTMAISILWRSNDGGKSDPSHEVSGMAGQLILSNTQSLVLTHLFVETVPNTTPHTGFYPDKLIFTPANSAEINANGNNIGDFVAATDEMRENLEGPWTGMIAGECVEINFNLPVKGAIQVSGTITYPNGKAYPIAGFTDIFALSSSLKLQGISFSTYIDDVDGRKCISMAGHLNLDNKKIELAKIKAEATAPDSTWYQVQLEKCELEKKN